MLRRHGIILLTEIPLLDEEVKFGGPFGLLSVCPVEPAVAPNQFRPKPQVPGLVGHLPQVSYVWLVSQSLKGK